MTAEAEGDLEMRLSKCREGPPVKECAQPLDVEPNEAKGVDSPLVPQRECRPANTSAAAQIKPILDLLPLEL